MQNTRCRECDFTRLYNVWSVGAPSKFDQTATEQTNLPYTWERVCPSNICLTREDNCQMYFQIWNWYELCITHNTIGESDDAENTNSLKHPTDSKVNGVWSAFFFYDPYSVGWISWMNELVLTSGYEKKLQLTLKPDDTTTWRLRDKFAVDTKPQYVVENVGMVSCVLSRR